MKKTLLLFITLLTATQLFAIPHVGKVNNIVIFISFPDSPMPDSIFRASHENLFFESELNLYDYFKEISYGKLDYNPLFYPSAKTSFSQNVSYCYRDTNRTDYYRQKSKVNPIGFEGDLWGVERFQREYKLLEDAVNYINTTTPVDSDFIIDADDDGYVDNVLFIINAQIFDRGGHVVGKIEGLTTDRIADLGFINGKNVNRYTFLMLYNGGINESIFAHELLHSLGAPDLYIEGNPRDSKWDTLPMGEWDMLAEGVMRYIHPSAYIKHKYLKWIDSIPEITGEGTYTLHPLFSDTNNCYQIKSPVSEDESFILEYRKREQGTHEANLLGSGLTICRANRSFAGNSVFGSNPGVELYIYRPDQFLNKAAFTDKEGRTNFNSYTGNPLCLLTDGSKGGISISNVKENEDGTLSFTFDGFDVAPYFQSKDTISIANMRNFTNYCKPDSTNLSTWSLSSPPEWLEAENDFQLKRITFKTLSINNDPEPRSTTVNLTVNGRLIKTFTLIQNPSPTATSLSHEMKEFSIYPNPVSNGVLKVESVELINKIEIFNLFGQKVFSQIVNQSNVAISVNHLSNGMYVVQCKFADGSMNNAKVIIN